LKGILVFFHCPANTGYAIAPLEKVFFRMAEALVRDWKQIHFAYTSLSNGFPDTLPKGFTQVIEFDPSDGKQGPIIERYLRNHNIDIAFGFDQPVSKPTFRYLRKGGLVLLVSYWGAPMSSINRGIKLWLKRVQVTLSRCGPDHYIFESNGMANTAVYGRGISASKTSVIYLGTDTTYFRPDVASPDYVYDIFSIPKDRRIFLYMGHMEKRKGVDSLIQAAKILAENYERRDFHLVILGNRDGNERVFLPLIADSIAQKHITFGGYRNDIPFLLAGCYAGLIGSTGWDSFPRSSIEMTASGLPLLVSDLPGLNETVLDGKTGFIFPPGDFYRLAMLMKQLLDDPILRNNLGNAARERAVNYFTIDRQLQELITIMNKLIGKII